MQNLELFFSILLTIQIAHSIEELLTGFHLKNPIKKFSFLYFLLFEILFLSFWISILFYKEFQYREIFMMFFNVLMFANGIWHLDWFLIKKQYISGVITAPLFIITFLIFCFKNLQI